MIPKVQKYTSVYFGVSAKDANRMQVSKTYTRKISKVVIHENYDQYGKTRCRKIVKLRQREGKRRSLKGLLRPLEGLKT